MKRSFLIAMLVALVQTSALSAGDSVRVNIQLPPGVSVHHADLVIDLYAQNGIKLGKTRRVSEDLTLTYPVAQEVGMLQLRKRLPNENEGSTLFLVAGVYFKQKQINISALTTIRALFTKEIQDVYLTIRDADKPRAEQLIVAMLGQETSRLVQSMKGNGYSLNTVARELVNKESYKTKANQITTALTSAIKSGELKVRAPSSVAKVRQSLEALISCQSNPLTYGSDPAEEKSLQQALQNEFERSADGAVLRRPIKLFGATVAQVFPGSLGAASAFAAILDTDMTTLRSNVQAAGVDLSQCTQEICEIKINKQATLLMMDSAKFTGKASKSGSATLLGCIYP